MQRGVEQSLEDLNAIGVNDLIATPLRRNFTSYEEKRGGEVYIAGIQRGRASSKESVTKYTS